MLTNHKKMGVKCSTGIKDQGTIQQICLRKQRTSGQIFRKTAELAIGKQRASP
jgi:hypothetical protein